MKVCDRCGGFYATEPCGEIFGGRACLCDPPLSNFSAELAESIDEQLRRYFPGGLHDTRPYFDSLIQTPFEKAIKSAFAAGQKAEREACVAYIKYIISGIGLTPDGPEMCAWNRALDYVAYEIHTRDQGE